MPLARPADWPPWCVGVGNRINLKPSSLFYALHFIGRGAASSDDGFKKILMRSKCTAPLKSFCFDRIASSPAYGRPKPRKGLNRCTPLLRGIGPPTNQSSFLFGFPPEVRRRDTPSSRPVLSRSGANSGANFGRSRWTMESSEMHNCPSAIDWQVGLNTILERAQLAVKIVQIGNARRCDAPTKPGSGHG